MKADSLHILKWCIAALAVMTILRLASLPFSLDIFALEEQYLNWSKSLAWGYKSQPPMVAFWAWLSTGICGDTNLCTRLSSPMLHSGTAIVIYFIGKALYRRRDGVWSAITYLTLPIVSISSSFITPDPSLMFFWALALLMFIHAVNQNKWKHWITCGTAIGFGLLSKYTMVFFFPSILLYLVTHKEHRHYLIKPKLWLSGLLALSIFMMNVLWNIEHQFAAFVYLQQAAQLAESLFNAESFFRFFGSQFIIFGPLLFLILLAVFLTIPERLKSSHAGLLLCFILPLIIFILLLSFVSNAAPDWVMPIYIPATVLVSHWLLAHRRYSWVLYCSLGINLAFFVLFHSYSITNKTQISQLVEFILFSR